VGLLLYGACRGIYASRRLQAACEHDVAFMYLMGSARPDFHTIATFDFDHLIWPTSIL
jgi:transposase